MRDLVCGVIIYCIQGCDMDKINVYHEIMTENQNK